MKTRKFFSGLIEGLASTGSILEPSRYPSLKGSDLSRLRSDVSRIGTDFHAVIERENDKEQEQAGHSGKGASACAA
jgi:hypothetical protein